MLLMRYHWLFDTETWGVYDVFQKSSTTTTTIKSVDNNYYNKAI